MHYDHSYPKGTVVVYNTLNFRFTIFEEYGTNRRTWPSHMAGHAYKASARDLRSIEERNLEDVLDSAIGMNLTVSLFPTANVSVIYLFFTDLLRYFAVCLGSISKHSSGQGQKRRTLS